jgi:hypothetical protein
MITLNSSEPKTFLISIAVSDYQHHKKLENAINDSERLIETLTGKYKVDLIGRLHNEEFTQDNLSLQVEQLKNKVSEKDSVIIFFNGHGTFEHDTAYWLKYNSTRENKNSWFPVSRLFEELEKIDSTAKDIVVIINSCYAGKVFHKLPNRITKHELGNKSRLVFTSSNINEEVDDESVYSSHHSPFTDTICELLAKNVQYKLPISKIIQNVKITFENLDYNSTPSFLSYGIHNDGGELQLLLQEGIDENWNKTKEKDDEQAYEDFLSKFPRASSNYTDYINNRLYTIQTEKKEWIITLKKIKNEIDNYTHSINGKKPKLVSEYKELHELINNQIERISEIKNSDDEWNTAKSQDSIPIYKEFIRNNPESRLVSVAKSRIVQLKESTKARMLWNDAEQRSNRNPKLIRAAYAEYLLYFPFKEHNKEAQEKLEEVELWIEIEDERLPEKKIDLLKMYLSKYEDKGGRFVKKARREQNNSNHKHSANKLKENIVLDLGNEKFNRLYNHQEFVEGLSDNEKIFYNEVSGLINEELEKFEKEINVKYSQLSTSNSIASISSFISDYQDFDVPDFLTERVEECKQRKINLDFSFFEQARENKSKTDFLAYIQRFENYEGVYLTDAKDALLDIEEYQSIDSEDDTSFKFYIDNFPHGLFVSEAEQRIAQIQRARNKEEWHQRLVQEISTKADLDGFLQKYEDDKDEMVEIIQEKLSSLLRNENKEREIKKIEEATEDKKIEICEKYLNDFEEEDDLRAVVLEHQRKAKNDYKASQLFENALAQQDVKFFSQYKELYPKGKNIDIVTDYILYMNVKNEENDRLKEGLEEIKEVSIKNKIEDHIAFNIAKEVDTLESFQHYADTTKEELHLVEAKEKVEEHKLMLNELKAFEFAMKDATEHGLRDYLINWKGISLEHQDQVKSELQKVKEIRIEREMFQQAYKIKSEKRLLEYMEKYSSKGQFYEDALDMIAELSGRSHATQIARENQEQNMSTRKEFTMFFRATLLIGGGFGVIMIALLIALLLK